MRPKKERVRLGLEMTRNAKGTQRPVGLKVGRVAERRKSGKTCERGETRQNRVHANVGIGRVYREVVGTVVRGDTSPGLTRPGARTSGPARSMHAVLRQRMAGA